MATKKAPGDSILIDVEEHADDLHPNIETASFHSNYEGGFHNSARTAIHMKRRTSDGGIEGTPVVVKASLDEMRSQLRLGPANRAANPRSNTRSLFKIKQGLGTNSTPPNDGSRPLPPRAVSHIGFTNTHGHSPARNAGHERTPLLGLGEDHEEAVEDDEHDGHNHKTNGTS
jgi:metal transporter CNNM